MKKQLIFGLAIAGAAIPVHAADDGDMEVMRQQLNTLKQQVEQLEQRLEQSEQQRQQAATEAQASGDSGLAVSTGAGHPRGKPLSRDEVKQIAGDTYDKKESQKVQVGGALRYNYILAEFADNQKDRGGDINFDTFRINVDADINNLLFSAEYRFYDYMRTIHHGWVGYRFADDSEVQVGISQVPFGLLPYASNNFYFSSNFYTGMEDDYDNGVKYVGSRGGFDYAFAFYKNDEKNDSGSDRYSIDATNLPTGNGLDDSGSPFTGGDEFGDLIQETNTGNIRLAYTLGKGTDYTTELGVSGQYGQIYNNTQNENYGHNEAYAVHLHGNYDRWEVMLQATQYEYDLDGDETVIGAAAYAFNYPFASEADSYIANVSYTLPLSVGPFDSIEFYNDYSYVGNKSGGFANTWQNVTGAALAAGNLYTYFDIINGKNEPFVNGFMTGNNTDTQTLFNINMGYYF